MRSVRLAVLVSDVRSLPLMVGLSMVATGLLGMLSVERSATERTTPLSEVLSAPLGTRVVVRGLLERLSAAGAAGATGNITDCAGLEVAVYFPRGVSLSWRFTLVTVVGVVHEYHGKPELVVEDPANLRIDVEGALALTPDEILSQWQTLVCREVGFTGRVARAAVSDEDPTVVHVAVEAAGGELSVWVHLTSAPALRVQVGAPVTFLGTVAAHGPSGSPVVHVRA